MEILVQLNNQEILTLERSTQQHHLGSYTAKDWTSKTKSKYHLLENVLRTQQQ